MPFRQQITRTPAIDVRWWSFAVIGAVAHPVIWSYADLVAMPQLRRWSPVVCPMTRINPTYREAIWGGVPLGALMQSVTPIGAPQVARIESADGYATVVPSHLLDRALLAIRCDDRPLSPDDGAPVRLIFPGNGGYNHAKWVERITLTHSHDGGVWEARGASPDASIQPASWLTHQSVSGGQVTLGGVALVPHESARGRILLSISSGMPISAHITAIRDEPSAGLRRLTWGITWRAPHSGQFPLVMWVDSGSDAPAPSHVYTLEVV
jgi:hypothetical protein